MAAPPAAPMIGRSWAAALSVTLTPSRWAIRARSWAIAGAPFSLAAPAIPRSATISAACETARARLARIAK